MRKILLLTLALWLHLLSVNAQESRCRLMGRVSDDSGSGLPNVTIRIEASGMVYGGATESDGRYDIQIPAASDSIDVTYSMLGFGTKTVRIMPRGHIKRDVTMSESATAISEVIVEGRSVIKKSDNVAYIPNKKQVNGANSGISLLSNLMIPQVSVNRMTGEVKANNGSGVSFYINGRKSSPSEIENLRPKDVRRVEYYDNPTDKFQEDGIAKVINYVLKDYEYGGYADLRTDTRWLYETGAYKAIVNYAGKKMKYTLTAGMETDKDTGKGGEAVYTYEMQPGFTKTVSPMERTVKNRKYYGLLRTTYSAGKTMLTIQPGMTWSETPDYMEQTNVAYSPQRYPDASALQTRYSRSIEPAVETSFSTSYGRHSTSVDLSYAYGSNRYKRTYTEGSGMDPTVNDTHEEAHTALLNLRQSMRLGRKSSVSLLMVGLYSRNETEYKGTITDNQGLEVFGLQLLPTYSQTFGDKLSLYLRAGIYLQHYKVSGEKSRTEKTPRVIMSLDYQPDGKSSISLYGYMLSNEPQLSAINSTEQQLNQYETMRGNPDLHVQDIYIAGLNYSRYMSRISLTAYAQYTGYTNMVKDIYTPEDGMMVCTFINDGSYHHLSLKADATAYLCGRSLQLKGGIGYERWMMRGLYSDNLSRFVYDFSATSFIGPFTISGYFRPSAKELGFLSYITKTRCDYGLAAAWGHKEWTAEVGCRRIFETSPFVDSRLDKDTYKYNMRYFSDAYDKQVYVKLSYNFDFGRKVEREDIRMATRAASAIMKP